MTPLLVGLLLGADGGFSADAVRDIALQLLLPFMLGQALRARIGPWIGRHKQLIGYVDRGSILLVVYTAFSEGVNAGLWRQVDAKSLIALVVIDLLLLAMMLVAMTLVSRALGFSKEDEITIVFCGSKKSLASGLPMAHILFAGQAVGVLVLPLMVFHQAQLIVCAAMARRYAAREDCAQDASPQRVDAPPAA